MITGILHWGLASRTSFVGRPCGTATLSTGREAHRRDRTALRRTRDRVLAICGGTSRDLRAAAVAGLLALLSACGPSPAPPGARPEADGWREFQGTWTATGSRHGIRLGDDRRASIAKFEGSVLLSGTSRPAVGFRAEAVVLSDSATGMVGRAVWTDERGDQAYSELKGEGTNTGNRIVGNFLGGTGRYRGATGTYEFSWRFVLESEDGTVQGQSAGLNGRVRFDVPQGAPGAGGSRP
jgi:hypothetical protein